MDVNELKNFAEAASKLVDSLKTQLDSTDLTPEQKIVVENELKKANFAQLDSELKTQIQDLKNLSDKL